MKKFSILILFLCSFHLSSQTFSVSGSVKGNNNTLAFANISIKEINKGAVADENGRFKIKNIPNGSYVIEASYTGYEPYSKQIAINGENITVDFNLIEDVLLDEVVITGTRTFKRKTNSPVIVNILNSETLNNVQACNLSDGLKFQPGLRVETDCQTCNYTQLRMNGLAGGYSQILINGRPIFSPLTGLYGLEQIPVNMIDRIETIRGGGSTLYGSSAIGGVVNIITKTPKDNSFDVNYTYQSIKGDANDHIINGNATIVSKSKKSGISLFVNKRERDTYDANDDNFSELPELKNTSFGTNFFFLPSENQKLEVSLSSLHEYRYGGEMVDKAPHLALQSEERTHNVLMGSLDYQINFNNDNSSIITYLAGQQTDRDHYTGIFPDEQIDIENHLSNPPYGASKTLTFQGGAQLNHRFNNFLKGSNVFTFGSEYVMDDVFDEINTYNYKIDQTTKTFATFLQSDWEITPKLNLLSGVRADKHNLVDKVIFSPRFSLLYKPESNVQFRTTWSTGFRAPQAFDTDLHIAFAGGGISRISLGDDLKEERSNSFSASINYDKPTEHYIFGFTLEGFYTHLKDAFYLTPLGEDAFGERFEKQNGDGATVKGLTFEVRANYNKKVQLEAGFNIQSSKFDSAVENIEGLPALRDFLRTPNEYGFAMLSFTPNQKFSTTLNYVYTGTMKIAHFAGAPEQTTDAYTTSKAFSELGIKSSYSFDLKNLDTGLEVFGGIKNIFNAYQSDFDSGKNRDSNYVYGSGSPRTVFVGLRIKSL
ncbi:TonB-dependent receptor [Pontimicrobium aquaticum]|uniref:TonB-dependent receptor n=1 Tax=Pontimicrobium aquaticum TaxID=2565367 RepID=A0A4U0ESJ6_9FLAO|nr:TonB-dependent receptor [Pontimicrobium aquaticum]TJY34690.1 TonB-dependent receptor [Pontimicrobium aquaticum]